MIASVYYKPDTPSTLIALVVLVLGSPAVHAADSVATHCEALGAQVASWSPHSDTVIESARWIDAGPIALPSMGPAPPRSILAPAHCELIGHLQSRVGMLGQHFEIRFHLRLPKAWNGRFLFQGGGGSNGELGDALGGYSLSAPPALIQGYAVVSQDSGHDNRANSDPSHSGALAFGFDPLARSNYGHASLPLVSDVAQAAVKQFYGTPAQHRYFVGCSKGGEEAMAVAQQYADRFDGIVAGAPGMSLPRAALAEAWDTQQFARLIPHATGQPPSFQGLHSVFGDADFALVHLAILEACDALDGVKDGLVSNPRKCTSARVVPALRRHACATAEAPDCLAPAKIEALIAVVGGPKDSRGHALYSEWAWDPGIGEPGWRAWTIGGSSGMPPALNVVLGAASLASVFTVEPQALPADPQKLFEWQLAFDLGHDGGKIYATDKRFTHSGWEDNSARSANLDGLRQHGGKLLVWHGVADPVFSIKDTEAWWQEAHQRYGGGERQFLRFFAVPGMNHCGGGETTGTFDVLASIVTWVEQEQAPDEIKAQAGSDTPWPGRERPLCAWPKSAQFKGSGDLERAESFACR